MCVGTATTAAIIIGGASAAGEVAKAKMASSAAKKAAATQSAGADKAMGVARQVYGQQMAGMAPYAALGRTQVNTLSRLMTPGVPYTSDLQQQDAAATAARNAPPPPAIMPGTRPRIGPPVGTAGPRNLAMSMQPPAPPGVAPPATVQLRAPDGSVQPVPENLVDQFLARGAQRV